MTSASPIESLDYQPLPGGYDELMDADGQIRALAPTFEAWLRKKIAEDVGYQTDTAFSRAFRREYGSPPATWRRSRLASSAR